MSRSLDSLREEFLANKNDKSYRHAYADESLSISISTQIKVLREQRELRQEDLAREAEMQQSMISRCENVNYSSWSISTLKKLAVAFDVWLDVRFRSFGELITTTDGFSRKALQVPKFIDDPFFKIAPGVAAKSQRPYDQRFSNVISIEIGKELNGNGQGGPPPIKQFKGESADAALCGSVS